MPSNKISGTRTANAHKHSSSKGKHTDAKVKTEPKLSGSKELTSMSFDLNSKFNQPAAMLLGNGKNLGRNRNMGNHHSMNTDTKQIKANGKNLKIIEKDTKSKSLVKREV